MTISPRSRWGVSSAMVSSTEAAGTISQIARGGVRCLTRSLSEAAPVAPSFPSSATAFADLSNATHAWPPRKRRRAILAPMRPRPIIPSSMRQFPFDERYPDRGLSEYPEERPIALPAASPPLLAITPDQIVGGAVMLERRLRRAFELWNDALGQRLAELHAPLVEAIDVPDRALGEDAVLIERDQLAERLWRQTVEQNHIGRPVALEEPVWDEPIWRSLRLDLLGGLAERQRLGLREHVSQQDVMVPPERIQALGEGDEIPRNQPRALMDQLVEGMLSVGAGLAPIDGPGIIIDPASLQRHVLAVALHRELLEIGGKALQILLVGQHGDGMGAEEIVVP